jgi:hypothetical protein
MYHADDGRLVRVDHLLGRRRALGLPGCPAIPAAGSATPAAEGARPAASAGGPPDAKLVTACMPCTPVTGQRCISAEEAKFGMTDEAYSDHTMHED